MYADGTLGALINWFKADCPNYAKLSGLRPATTTTRPSIGWNPASTARLT